MDLSDLRVFQAVAQQGGIGRAAKVLHRVASNVTTRIQNLESDLGVLLFVREGRRLQLSPQGVVLLDYANRLLALAMEARAAMQTRQPQGVLRLGAMESTAAVRLPALLSSLYTHFQGLSVELSTGAPRPLTVRVLSGQLDAALVAEPVSDNRLATQLAFVEPLVIIGPKGHPPIRTARDLRSTSLLAFEPDCPHRQRLEAWCFRSEVAPQRIIEVGSYHAILGCCIAGMGVALIPESVLGTYSERAHLSVHPLRGEFRSVKIYLVWLKDAPQANIDALAEMLTVQNPPKNSANSFVPPAHLVPESLG